MRTIAATSEPRPQHGWEGLSPPYKTIVADPPWPYADGATLGQRSSGKAHFLPYSTMDMHEIASLPIAELAACDAHLYLWTTERFLWQVPAILSSWGFVRSGLLAWCKPPNGTLLGSAFTPTTEFVVFARRKWGDAIQGARLEAGLSVAELQRAVRGSVTGLASMWERSVRYPSEADWAKLERVLGTRFNRAGHPKSVDRNWFTWPRGAHSVKPAAFFDLVERVSPASYVELFARQPRLGWDHWGWGYEARQQESIAPSTTPP